MVVIIRNEKSQQMRIVDLKDYTISQFMERFNPNEWDIVKYIHR